MSYGFDDNKGKVPIEPILNNLQTTYQNNVNTIYNAIKNQGTTPAGKTPQQIATAIGTMATNKFNAGVSAADARVNINSASYQAGVTYADGRVNTSSASYQAGVTYADGRANPSSANYQAGRTAGIAYADGRANPDSVNYQAGKTAGITEAESHTWIRTMSCEGMGYVAGNIHPATVQYQVRDVASGHIKNNSGSGYKIYLTFYNSSDTELGTHTVSDGETYNIEFPSSADKLVIDGDGAVLMKFDLTLQYRTKLIR